MTSEDVLREVGLAITKGDERAEYPSNISPVHFILTSIITMDNLSQKLLELDQMEFAQHLGRCIRNRMDDAEVPRQTRWMDV